MLKKVKIDFLPENVQKYKNADAIVAIDVIRATTTAMTALATNRQCYVVSSLDHAESLHHRLKDVLLAGELGGNTPFGYDETNSPYAIHNRSDIEKPMILLSTSGTPLLQNAKNVCENVYAACLRNISVTAEYLANNYNNIVLMGAGSRREFRIEDQYGCALIAAALIKYGFQADNKRTEGIINRWKDEEPIAIAKGNSADYLKRSEQLHDLDFILRHIDDLNIIAKLERDELVNIIRKSTANYSTTEEVSYS